MKIAISQVVRVSVVLAAAISCGMAQQTAPGRRSVDVRNAQPRNVITASPLCQRTMANPQGPNGHEYDIDRSTLLPDLESLMQSSEDVILTTSSFDGFEGIAPSGDDIVRYIDVKVLRVWKGSHKAGDTLTFTVPDASVDCSPMGLGKPSFQTTTGLSYLGATSGIDESYILFLRHSRGGETQLTPGLRMTGGSGMQGMYHVPFPMFSPLTKESHCQNDISGGKYPEDAKLCMEFLETSDLPIAVPLTIDPLFKKYDKMPISEFLREVQDAADSLGYPATKDRIK